MQGGNCWLGHLFVLYTGNVTVMCSGFILGAFSHTGGEAVGYLEGHGGDSQERESEGHRCEQLRRASSAGALCALHHPSFGQPGEALE